MQTPNNAKPEKFGKFRKPLYFCIIQEQQKAMTMTTQEFKTTTASKFNLLSTYDLIVEVKKLSNDFSIGADLIFDVAMDILMERLPECEFIEPCNEL